MLYIVKTFLYNYRAFEATLPEDRAGDVAKDNIIFSVYSSILELYPPFSIEAICSSINQELYLAELSLSKGQQDEDLLDALEEKEADIKGIRSIEDINKIKKFLFKRVIGQNEAIELLVDGLKLVASGLRNRASFFFLGKTGVGKTLAGKLFGSKYSGNFYKINCGELESSHQVNKLLGSPPGYIGSSDKSIFKEKADKSNKWVFLWDEIEKANSKVYDLLLGLLDDGKITDNNGKELDFTKSIHIFTSNIGIRDLKSKSLGFSDCKVTYENSHEDIEDAIKRQFSPEFINRIENFVYFNALSTTDVYKIVNLELKKLPIIREEEVINFIVEKAFSVEYGAREIDRYITKNVATLIADAILNKKVPLEGTFYSPKIEDGKIVLNNLKDYASKKIEVISN